jgi:hypothetical protein
MVMLVKEWTLEEFGFWTSKLVPGGHHIKEIKLVLLYFSYKIFPSNFDFQSQNVMSKEINFLKKCIAPVCECVCVCFSFLLF